MLTNDYKYITMIKIEDKPKTSVFAVESKHEEQLGIIKWFPQWRQYCFFPKDDCVFSLGCMIDINHFINQLKDERKSKCSLCDNPNCVCPSMKEFAKLELRKVN